MNKTETHTLHLHTFPNTLVSSSRFRRTQFPIWHAIFRHPRNQGNFPVRLTYRTTDIGWRLVFLLELPRLYCEVFYSALPATLFPLLPSHRVRAFCCIPSQLSFLTSPHCHQALQIYSTPISEFKIVCLFNSAKQRDYVPRGSTFRNPPPHSGHKTYLYASWPSMHTTVQFCDWDGANLLRGTY